MNLTRDSNTVPAYFWTGVRPEIPKFG